MTDDKLTCALSLQRQIRNLAYELEEVGTLCETLPSLSAQAKTQIRDIAKREIEIKLSQLRQEFESM